MNIRRYGSETDVALRHILDGYTKPI